jgi:hypothetical protein
VTSSGVEPPPLCALCQTTAAGYSYQHPRVTVERVSIDRPVIEIELSVDWGTWHLPFDNLRPASLLEAEHPHESVIDLYRLGRADLKVLKYSTVESAGTIPKAGSTYLLSVWWTPDAVKAVEDPSIIWKRTRWDDPTDHDHCWLCSRTIGEGSDPSLWEGYTAAGHYRWLCPDCYQKYVEHGPPWAPR